MTRDLQYLPQHSHPPSYLPHECLLKRRTLLHGVRAHRLSGTFVRGGNTHGARKGQKSKTTCRGAGIGILGLCLSVHVCEGGLQGGRGGGVTVATKPTWAAPSKNGIITPIIQCNIWSPDSPEWREVCFILMPSGCFPVSGTNLQITQTQTCILLQSSADMLVLYTIL